jgi:hypothetical protein|tara:strand:+ start:26 stop:238 length:213 start_codon:yes stop_codon:yes gene_type:complete
MQERIYKALISKYTAQMEEALLKIDMLMSGNNQPVIVNHTDILGEIDKLLAIVAAADEKMAKLRRFYGTH